jgi:hypothetical protein
MEDLAKVVVSQLRACDGGGSMSILQGRDCGSYLLVTPVTKDGKTSFDVRNFLCMYQLEDRFDKMEGMNFATAQQTAEFMAAHAATIWNDATYIRFVETLHCKDGPTHLSLKLDKSLDSFVKILETLVRMRPLQYRQPMAGVVD